MKKANCRRTSQEKEQHARATKIRKMTDSQICGLFDSEYSSDGKVAEFLDKVKVQGVGKVTIKKIREAAIDMGYITE